MKQVNRAQFRVTRQAIMLYYSASDGFSRADKME
jgi:hypothetical protein